jgi:hypothetical protein
MSSVAPRDIVSIGKMALADHIDQLVSHRPGMTGPAVAKSLFGHRFEGGEITVLA